MEYNINSQLWDDFKSQKKNLEQTNLEQTNLKENKEKLLKNEIITDKNYENDLEIYDYCYHCEKFSNTIEDSLKVCLSCGVITDFIIDSGAEWRYYGFDDNKGSDPTRCGLPTNDLLPESSLGSIVSYKYNESFEMKKIRNYHSWNAMPYKERSLYNVFDNIKVRALNSGIPLCIIEEANIMYKKISETRISRGSNRKGIIASCIFKACKIKNVPRSAKEIADIFQLSVTHMTKGCKKFDEIMNINKQNDDKISLSSSKSDDFIQRFCSKLSLDSNIGELCEHVCIKADEYSLVCENTPPSIAAGSIYLVCSLLNINLTKKEISKSCKISEVTISKCYKKLFKYHKHLIPQNILTKLYS